MHLYLCVCECVCVYLPEISHSGGQGTLSGNVGWVPGIVIHLWGEEKGQEGVNLSRMAHFEWYNSCLSCLKCLDLKPMIILDHFWKTNVAQFSGS